MTSVIQTIRTRTGLPLIDLLLPLGVGLVLGVSVALVPPWLAMIGIVLLMGLAVALKKPVIFLLLLVIVEATVLPEDSPYLSVNAGPATLFMSDVLILLALGTVVIKLLYTEDYTLVRTPLDLPMLAFLGMAVAITLVRLHQSSYQFQPWAIPRLRTVLLFGTFFVVTNVIRDREQLRILLIGMMVIGGLVGLAMIAQFILGESVTILPGRVEGLVTESVSYSGVTRVLPPGQSTVLTVALLAATALILTGIRPGNVWWLAVAGAAGVAVLLTFNRSFWGIVMMFIGMLFLLVRGRSKVTLLAGILLGVLVLAGAALTGSARVQKLIDASLIRLQSFVSVEGVENDSSLQWREIETSYVWPAIEERPLFGYGLGATYRPLDTRLDWEEFDGRRYIHNGHLWLITKTGVFSYLIFIGLSVLFVIRGLRHWRLPDSPLESAVILSSSLLYIGILAAAIVNPIFSQQFWTPIIGIMMGLNEVIIRLNQGDASADA